jgi:hypothetical protein
MELPNISAVYIIKTAKETLYVGSTVTLRARLRAHHRKDIFNADPTIIIEYIPCEIHNLGKLETLKIKELLPKLNAYGIRTPYVEKTPLLFYPLGWGNPSTSLRDKTIYLLNSQREKTLKQIGKETDINIAWLSLFSRGKSLNPGVNTVQKLYEHLTKSKLNV